MLEMCDCSTLWFSSKNCRHSELRKHRLREVESHASVMQLVSRHSSLGNPKPKPLCHHTQAYMDMVSELSGCVKVYASQSVASFVK